MFVYGLPISRYAKSQMIYLQYVEYLIVSFVIIQMQQYKLPEQCEKIKQRLYVFVDTKDIDQNIRLNLVVNPQIIKILINQLSAQSSSTKLQLVRQMSNIFGCNSFNSLILAKRDRQIMQFNHSILESLISFIFTIKDYKDVDQLANMINPFIHSYPINTKIVKNILSIITKDFYYEQLNHQLLQLSLKLLTKIMKHQRFKEGQPNSYFITYGQETGIKMISKSVKWPFSKGFHIYLKFFMQAPIVDDMTIFTLAVENDEFVVFITPQGQLRIKVFSQEEPLYIAILPSKEWITLSLSYTLKSKLLRNYYEVLCIIDGEIHERRDLPVPQSVGMSSEIVQLSLGRNFYGLIHTFLLSRSQIKIWNKLVLNNWSEIESFLVINKKMIRQLFAFYHPLLTTCLNQKDIVYDITSQNHGEVFQNTGIFVNPFRTVDVNYYGGLYTYLPYLHILKFYPPASYLQALTDIFELYYTFFENQFGNVEVEAINCQFFSIASQLINELDFRFINKSFIVILTNISNKFKNILLKKDYLVGFLWKINTRKIQDPQIIQGLFEIIEKYYLQFFQWSYGLFSLDDIFHYVIDNFEPKKVSECCFSHFALIEGGETVDPLKFALNFAARTKVLKNILKIVFVNLGSFESIQPISSQVMQILFGAYSPCLKLLLLQSLCQGVKANSAFYIRQFNILNYMFLYLPQTHLPDQLATIFEIMLNCIEQDEENKILQKNVIARIAECLDKIYKKRCEEVRFRSNTDRLKVRLKNQQRKYSEEKIVVEKTKKLNKKLHRGSPIESNRSLYQSILKLCFYYDKGEQDCLLKHDEYVLILQPYFKICCISYRKNIINMIRNTVILAGNGKSILDNLTKFDRLYKLLLNEFVLKELQPDSPQYFPTEQTNYIIRNVYFVIDFMIMGIRNDWGHLYLYILRLLGLLQQTKKDIMKRTDRLQDDISFAIRVTLRKFVLRIIKLAERDVHNLTNLVFLVYLTVFGNEKINKEGGFFKYYHNFEHNLFIGGYSIISSDTVTSREQESFVDYKLILQTASSFRIHSIDLRKTASVKISNFINSYLDLQYTNQQSQLFKNKAIYLVSAEFRLLKPSSEGPLRNLLAGFLGDHSKQNVSIGQTFSIMLGLCIQSAISTNNIALLSQSLNQMQFFALQLLLLSSRDGLKQSQHPKRNRQLPKSIISNVFHFLYEMIQMNKDQKIRSLVVDTLYYIFYFLGLLINCLYDKLGRPQNIDLCLQLAAVSKKVQEYNFFTYELVRQIFRLKQMIQIPNIDKQKAVQIILHPKVAQYFKNVQRVNIESKVEQTTSIHKCNVAAIKKQIQIQFEIPVLKEIPSQHLINLPHFQRTFVVDYLRLNNLYYRKTQRIWRKIWKRLRVYHYFWSVGMNQRENLEIQYRKNYSPAFRHKFSKFLDENGVRSILQIEPIEPWHVKRILMQKQFEYRNSNYLYSLHHEQRQIKQMSILQKILNNSKEKDQFFVDWIKNNSKRKGYLSIQQQKLKFKYLSTYQKDSHLQFTSFILAEHKPIEKYWPLVEIINIQQRRYLTLKQCLLIQFQDSSSLIFNFINNDKEHFLNLLQNKQTQKSDKMLLLKLNKVTFYTHKFNYSPNAAVQQAFTLWKNHKISNFKYLNLLNKYAGRSYLDPANFPVFPWILSSYDSEEYKYRDLSKTIGALGNQQLIQHYRSKTQTMDPFDPVPPYQYGTHYSSPGMVFNFLIRLQPYTQAARTLQGGKFDLSDRLFNSIRICWQSVTSQVSDVRQLIPQFYYLPEFLLNIQQYNFGLTQMKDRVHNVHLPIWCKNAYDFIKIHRLEFQSEQVGQHLQEWIDLIFGYKQKGKIAQENLNLFYYLTYQNSIDLKEIQDTQIKVSKEAQIMHFGQTPSQLFYKPHLPKNKPSQKSPKSFKKVRMLLCLQGSGQLGLLYKKDGKLAVFHEYSVKLFSESNNYNLHSQIKVLRNNSKQNIYFIEDIDFTHKVVVFGNNQFIAIGSYVNGDLAIYSLVTGKKIQEKKGSPRNCIFVNKAENLLFSGGKNGLLQVFQIIYGEKDTVTLIKIAFQYYQSPIYSISQGGNFYAVASGNLVAIVKISRSLTYVYDKIKMRGIKMVRSFQASRNVDGVILCPQPLFCAVFFNSMELCSYSINGQLLKTKQTELAVAPQRIKGDNFMDLLASVQGNKLIIYSTPFLQIIRTISLPNKIYKQMKFLQQKCYLSTNQGQILYLAETEHQQND